MRTLHIPLYSHILRHSPLERFSSPWTISAVLSMPHGSPDTMNTATAPERIANDKDPGDFVTQEGNPVTLWINFDDWLNVNGFKMSGLFSCQVGVET